MEDDTYGKLSILLMTVSCKHSWCFKRHKFEVLYTILYGIGKNPRGGKWFRRNETENQNGKTWIESLLGSDCHWKVTDKWSSEGD